jgi:hypothetical protein
VPSKHRVIRRSSRSERRLAEVDILLDTFEARVRAGQARIERRIYERRVKAIYGSMDLDSPREGSIGGKPSLSFYDGHEETHGQD